MLPSRDTSTKKTIEEARAELARANILVSDYKQLLSEFNPPDGVDVAAGGGSGVSLSEELVADRAAASPAEVRALVRQSRKESASLPMPALRFVEKAAAPSEVLELFLDGLRLKDIGTLSGSSPLALYPALRKLSLAENLLTILALTPTIVRDIFHSLPDLREVIFDSNRIAKDSFLPALAENCPLLELVSLQHNCLQAFSPISQCPFAHLQSLDLSHNEMSSFSAAKLRAPHLTSLDLSFNKLASIEGVSTLTALQVLTVSHNALTSLRGIETLTSLEELHASHNLLRCNPMLTHNNPLRPAGGAGNNLRMLDVSHNEISSLAFFPSALAKVWHLDLSSNAFIGAPGADAGAAERGPVPEADNPPRRGVLRGRSQKADPAPLPQKPQSADKSTFSSRLASIFPTVEYLNLSHNGREILPSYADLVPLSKLPLTELVIDGTIDGDTPHGSGLPPARGGRLGASEKDKQLGLFLAILPQLEMLNKAPVPQRLQSSVQADGRPLTASRPTSAKAVVRDGASATERSNALEAARVAQEKKASYEALVAMVARASESKERCHSLCQHMHDTTAWALSGGTGDRPPSPLRAPPQRRVEAGDSTSDSDDDRSDAGQNTPPPPMRPPQNTALHQSPRTKQLQRPRSSGTTAEAPVETTPRVSSAQLPRVTRGPPLPEVQRGPALRALSKGHAGAVRPLGHADYGELLKRERDLQREKVREFLAGYAEKEAPKRVAECSTNTGSPQGRPHPNTSSGRTSRCHAGVGTSTSPVSERVGALTLVPTPTATPTRSTEPDAPQGDGCGIPRLALCAMGTGAVDTADDGPDHEFPEGAEYETLTSADPRTSALPSTVAEWPTPSNTHNNALIPKAINVQSEKWRPQQPISADTKKKNRAGIVASMPSNAPLSKPSVSLASQAESSMREALLSMAQPDNGQPALAEEVAETYEQKHATVAPVVRSKGGSLNSRRR